MIRPTQVGQMPPKVLGSGRGREKAGELLLPEARGGRAEGCGGPDAGRGKKTGATLGLRKEPVF